MTTMHDIKQAVPNFFARDTMRFFRSKIESGPLIGPGGIYFLTSEQFDDEFPRLYTVRHLVASGTGANTHTVKSHPAFQHFEDKTEARAHAKDLAKGEDS